MWIEVQNLCSKLSRATDLERRWLREYLSFEDAKAKYIRRHAGGDGRIRMFNLLTEQFPTGFLPMVKRDAAKEGFQVDVLDRRAVPCAVDPNADISWLRDYQREAALKSIEKVRGILWMTTGAGKTEVAVALAQMLPCRWLFLVHRSTLMGQTAERYELRTGTPAGIVGDGAWNTKPRFVVATFQTLAAKLRTPEAQALLSTTEGLIIDEAHVLPADSFLRVSNSTPAAYFRIGMSGTPLARGDRRSVLAIATTGPVIYRLRADPLIAAGILAKPKIRMSPIAQDSQRPTWQGVYGECVVRSAKRNGAVADAAKRATKPCLVFVKEIRHGKLLVELLHKRGITAEFVWGTGSTEQRDAAIRRLVRGDVEVLVCSVIFQEGVDIPALRSVVIASGGSSVIAAIQRVGRGMRNNDGTKSTFEVYDFADKGNLWLERHARARLRAYAAENYEVFQE